MIQQGNWTFGIAHPVYALKEYGYTHEFDRGALLNYLIFEGEPGVVTLSSEIDAPAGLSDSLQQERINALPGRIRDIAYSLAVLGVDYQKNRDSLMSSLDSCLARPAESAEDDLCDSDLLDFVINLYWRGDGQLLEPLLQMADTRRDVMGDIGAFYADLLDRRSAATLAAIGGLPFGKGQLVCRLAAEDLSLDSPKSRRVVTLLRDAGSEVGQRCLAEFDGKEQ